MVVRWLKRLLLWPKKFGSDEQGGPELSNVLILALVSVPLIIALMVFARWAYEQFDAWLDKMN